MKKMGWLGAVGAIVFCLFHFFLGKTAVRSLSPTFDEAIHLTAGYIYLTQGNYPKQYRYNGFDHPPLGEMWPAIPLLFKNLTFPYDHPAWATQKWRHIEQYPFADEFLYKNQVSADTLFDSARTMQLALSLLFGVYLFWFVNHIAGRRAAIISCCFWAFCPSFLAQGTLVTTDLAFAIFFFVFISLLVFPRTRTNVILTGLALGGALLSKYSCIVIAPALVAMYLWNRRKSIFKTGFQPAISREHMKSGFLIFVFALLLVAVIYRFSGLDIFYKGLRETLFRVQRGHKSFFLGSFENEVRLLYFPFLFLVKTPLPLLLGLVLSFVLIIRKKIKLNPYLIIPPLIFFLVACLAKKQIGHRYILPIYPFLYVIAGVGLAQLQGKKALISALLLGWHFVEAWQVKPNFLAYFNELIGGPKNGYKYVTDSNVDWGQGLEQLKTVLTTGDLDKGIFLNYFGVVDPHYYGIRYVRLGTLPMVPHDDDKNKPDIAPTTFVISVTQLQADLAGAPPQFQWLGSYQPHLVAYSLLVYDFSGNPAALQKLRGLAGVQ